MTNARRALSKQIGLAAYGALLALIIVWETWLAPETPVSRAFWLALKTAPLFIAIPGLWRGSPRAYVLAALIVLIYFSEGVADVYHTVRTGASGEFVAALFQVAASLIFIAAAPIYARLTWRDPPALAEKGS